MKVEINNKEQNTEIKFLCLIERILIVINNIVYIVLFSLVFYDYFLNKTQPTIIELFLLLTLQIWIVNDNVKNYKK